jgi:hypothetical protein
MASFTGTGEIAEHSLASWIERRKIAAVGRDSALSDFVQRDGQSNGGQIRLSEPEVASNLFTLHQPSGGNKQ